MLIGSNKATIAVDARAIEQSVDRSTIGKSFFYNSNYLFFLCNIRFINVELTIKSSGFLIEPF
jgi:hypothetical protein